MRGALAGIFVAACLLVGHTARAQEEAESPAVQEARQRFDLGMRHAQHGDWALALAEWQRVQSILDSTRHARAGYVVYNVARANEELGRTREAIAAYQHYLEATANDPSAPSGENAERHLRELRMRRQVQSGAPEAGAGAFSPSPVGIAIGAVGTPATVAGAIVGGLALSQADAARVSCDGMRCTPETHAAIGDAQTVANVADGLLWSGLAVSAAGVVLAFGLGETAEAPASVACAADGCAAMLHGRF